jgi:hypothetical protein
MYFDYHVYTEMMKFCQVFWLSCLYRNEEVLLDILTIMFIQKWWSSARYFDYHVYTEMMKFCQGFWLMKFCQVFWLMKFCQIFWLSCLCRNDEVLPDILTIMFIQKWWSSARDFDHQSKSLAELHHFCINMIVKIPGRTSSFLYKHDSQNIWKNFLISV